MVDRTSQSTPPQGDRPKTATTGQFAATGGY